MKATSPVKSKTEEAAVSTVMMMVIVTNLRCDAEVKVLSALIIDQ